MTDPGRPPAPGWYHDGAGLRWWDGAGWGPYAPAAVSRTEEEAGRTLSIISHLGSFFGAFILPLVIFLIEKDRNRFTRWHAVQALNFQLTFLVAWIVGLVAWFGVLFGLVVSGRSSSSTSRYYEDAGSALPAGVVAVFGLLIVLMLVNFGFGIYGAIKAGSGEWWRNRWVIPFVRAGEPPR